MAVVGLTALDFISDMFIVGWFEKLLFPAIYEY